MFGTVNWPQTTVLLPLCSIDTCMHIISLYRSITNQTNLVSKLHFERDIISFFIAPKWLMTNHGCEALYVKFDKERKENKNRF